MGALTELGDGLEWVALRMGDLYVDIEDIPILYNNFGAWLLDCSMDVLYMGKDARDADEQLFFLWADIQQRLTWEQASEKITSTWAWMRDLPGYLRSYILEYVRAAWYWIEDVRAYTWQYAQEQLHLLYPWATDVWGYVRDHLEGYLKTTYDWISDLPGTVIRLVGEWIAVNLLPWLEAQAEAVVCTASKILEAVW